MTELIAANPCEANKLLGDLDACHSYRLTYKDRIDYSFYENKKIVSLERAGNMIRNNEPQKQTLLTYSLDR